MESTGKKWFRLTALHRMKLLLKIMLLDQLIAIYSGIRMKNMKKKWVIGQFMFSLLPRGLSLNEMSRDILLLMLLE